MRILILIFASILCFSSKNVQASFPEFKSEISFLIKNHSSQNYDEFKKIINNRLGSYAKDVTYSVREAAGNFSYYSVKFNENTDYFFQPNFVGGSSDENKCISELESFFKIHTKSIPMPFLFQSNYQLNNLSKDFCGQIVLGNQTKDQISAKIFVPVKLSVIINEL